jgi:DUF4097 and DUF4098 domain-containing protein YvlB
LNRESTYLKTSCKFAAALLLLLSAAGPRVAAQNTAAEHGIQREDGKWVQQTNGTLAAAKNLRVKVDVGSVRIEGGPQTGISYSVQTRAFTPSEDKARSQLANYKISSYVHGDTAWIVGEWEGSEVHRFSGEFLVNVPREIESVKVETEGGSVSAAGVAGQVDAETGGGKIHMENIGGSVNAQTGGDSIEIGSVGGDLSLETGGGKVYVGSVKGKLNASTGGGDIVLVSSQQGAVLEAGGGNIEVKQCGGRLKVSTGGGNIEIGDVGGPVDIETGGGSIHLGSAKGPVRAETGAGRIELGPVPSAQVETGAGGIVARFTAGGEGHDSSLETSAGDITVYLAPNLPITVRAAIELANGHSIQTDFPEIHVSSEGGEWGPKTITAEGSLAGGGPVLKIRTTTGDINIRRGGQ